MERVAGKPAPIFPSWVPSTCTLCKAITLHSRFVSSILHKVITESLECYVPSPSNTSSGIVVNISWILLYPYMLITLGTISEDNKACYSITHAFQELMMQCYLTSTQRTAALE